MFNPLDNYWLAEDGRVYGSAKEVQATDTDADYLAWLGSFTPTPWPKDKDGAQTDASLQEVLWSLGRFANLKYYAADKRWRKETGGITATMGAPIRTDDRSQAKITGLYTASQEVPTAVTPYQAADGTIWQLDAAGMYQLHVDLLTHINNCFAVSFDVLNGIADGSITTREQVDAAFDAPITQARKDWLKKV